MFGLMKTSYCAVRHLLRTQIGAQNAVPIEADILGVYPVTKLGLAGVLARGAVRLVIIGQ